LKPLDKEEERPKDYEYFLVAVTDVHLGYKETDKRAFDGFIREFVGKHTIENFIVMGDFLDLWRSDDRELVRLLTRRGRPLRVLNERKKSGSIGKLHYVVGNHDFNVFPREGKQTRYKQLRSWFRRHLMWAFPMKKGNQSKYPELHSYDLKSPSCVGSPQWLELPHIKRTYRFLHGHQVGWEAKAGRWYDAWSRYCCNLGERWAMKLSWLWEHRQFLLVILAAALLGFFLVVSGLIAAVLVAVVMVSMSIVRCEWRKRKLQRMDAAEKMLELIKELARESRKQKCEYLYTPPEERSETPEKQREFLPSEEESQHMITKYRKLFGADLPREELDEFLQGPSSVTSVSPPSEGLDDYWITGHTHDHKHVGCRFNLGCWEKNKPHLFLTVDNNGNCELWEWVREGDPGLAEDIATRYEWKKKPYVSAGHRFR
jgi:UDP-2,3-diacylglucosamine pyrophosphatase LpxH